MSLGRSLFQTWLDSLHARGVVCRLEGDQIRVSGWLKLTPEERQTLRENKPKIFAILQTNSYASSQANKGRSYQSPMQQGSACNKKSQANSGQLPGTLDVTSTGVRIDRSHEGMTPREVFQARARFVSQVTGEPVSEYAVAAATFRHRLDHY